MNSFIAWVGGKKNLSKTIVAMIPEHHCYVEVFGGAGWVMFRKGPEPSKVEVWNDLNADLVNLFRVVRDELDVFKRRQFYLLASRDEYMRFQKALKAGTLDCRIDRAIAYYYCIKNSFGAGIYSGFAFGASRGPKYGMGLDRLEEVRDRLKRVYIENLSFERLIATYDRPETLFYCDPPYAMLLSKGKGQYYQHEFTDEDHVRLRDSLASIQGRFVLSYDDHELVRELYKGRRFRIHEAGDVYYSTNNRAGRSPRRRPELLITNFKPKTAS